MKGHPLPICSCDRDCAIVNNCQMGGVCCSHCDLWFCAYELNERGLCPDCAKKLGDGEEDESDARAERQWRSHARGQPMNRQDKGENEMTNIEKYKETKDALEAYDSLDSKRVPFDIWLECEFEATRKPTLLEVAQEVVTAWRADGCVGVLEAVRKRVADLADAIAREKRKSVRNCDRYRTAEEAFGALMKFCNGTCSACPFRENINNGVSCFFTWLYAEANKEEAK